MTSTPLPEHICHGGTWNNGTKQFECEHTDPLPEQGGFNERLIEVRKLVANYVYSEGCGCCEGDSHESDKAALAEALGVPMYKDNSGYDFSKFMEDTNGTK